MNFLFYLFLFYKKHSPIQRGKTWLGFLFERLSGPISIRHASGIYLVVLPSSQMDLSYFDSVNASHDIILKEIESLDVGSVFVDIGANIGFFSFLAAKHVTSSGKVISFEPSKREFSRLTAGMAANGLNNIHPFNVALSETSAWYNLEIDKSHTGLNAIVIGDEPGSAETLGLSLDQILYTVNTHFDLVKIDVEGAEMLVLNGMKEILREKKVKRLVIEITDQFLQKFGSSKVELYTYLKNFGYIAKYNSDVWQYDEVFELK